jgi:hypothetical protein
LSQKWQPKLSKAKIAKEKEKPTEGQDQGLIAHWEKTVANCRQNIAKLERRLSK